MRVDATVRTLADIDQVDPEALEILPRVAVGGIFDVRDDDVVAGVKVEPARDDGQAMRRVWNEGNLVCGPGVDEPCSGSLDLLYAPAQPAADVGPSFCLLGVAA